MGGSAGPPIRSLRGNYRPVALIVTDEDGLGLNVGWGCLRTGEGGGSDKTRRAREVGGRR